MKHFLLSLVVLSSLISPGLSHQDATADPASVHMTFNTRSNQKRSVELVFEAPVQRGIIKSLTVHYFKDPISVPAKELKGIEKIQLGSLKLRYSSYRDGRKYCYIDALFGSDIGTSKPVFKRVWILFVDGKYQEYTIFPSQSDYRSESTKLNGEPIKKANKSQ